MKFMLPSIFSALKSHLADAIISYKPSVVSEIYKLNQLLGQNIRNDGCVIFLMQNAVWKHLVFYRSKLTYLLDG